MKIDLSGTVLTPDSASLDIRRHLGLKESDTLRVTFIPGPGDVAGTFEHWFAKRHEPRVPIVAYSLMFYELMERLNANCQVISINPIRQSGQTINDRFEFQQITPYEVKGRWRYFLGQYLFARNLISIVRRYNPHIVITSTHNPSASWKRLSNGRKLVLTAHNTFWPRALAPQTIKGRFRRRILAARASAIHAAICTSDECAVQVAELTGGRVLGEVECPQIVEKYPIEIRSEMQNLLFLGRIEESKGIFLLMNVFEQLAEQYLELKLVIAGDGGAEERLRARLAGSSFSDRIKYCGRIDSSGVHSAIAAADLVVCPTMTTFNEGLAVVGFEAAAHGIPTLLSSVVPAADLLSDSCMVFEADNAIALRQALSSIIEDPAAYRRQCAATLSVRDMIYNRSLSWGSGLFRALMKS